MERDNVFDVPLADIEDLSIVPAVSTRKLAYSSNDDSNSSAQYIPTSTRICSSSIAPCPWSSATHLVTTVVPTGTATVTVVSTGENGKNVFAVEDNVNEETEEMIDEDPAVETTPSKTSSHTTSITSLHRGLFACVVAILATLLL